MRDSIAIVGMGCIFPDAVNKEEYWKNLENGFESIKDLTKEQIGMDMAIEE